MTYYLIKHGGSKMDSPYFCTPCQHTIRAALAASKSNPDTDSEEDNDMGENLGPTARAHDQLSKAGFRKSGASGGRESMSWVFTHQLQRNLHDCDMGQFSDSDSSYSTDDGPVYGFTSLSSLDN